jgi:hypothetical protein
MPGGSAIRATLAPPVRKIIPGLIPSGLLTPLQDWPDELGDARYAGCASRISLERAKSRPVRDVMPSLA